MVPSMVTGWVMNGRGLDGKMFWKLPMLPIEKTIVFGAAVSELLSNIAWRSEPLLALLVLVTVNVLGNDRDSRSSRQSDRRTRFDRSRFVSIRTIEQSTGKNR